ncbi:unique cartilage matrix-associated protein isoform X2 [Sceloporus undulatus]|uniref:unique cartilage matrix-associated protein isoform X2 n=1 Tax=Sceloporus undulatus TaxID=8520 RepID=UPI001C4CC538|nr:unique cartilage matrix-associated protein isoform X2 [Sceloporus undulatus]
MVSFFHFFLTLFHIHKSNFLIQWLLNSLQLRSLVIVEERETGHATHYTGNKFECSETRQMLAADEQRREYYEEQRNEFENFVEEERDEQDERSREQIEQWREYHYDGLYPPYQYNRHIV